MRYSVGVGCGSMGIEVFSVVVGSGSMGIIVLLMV